jgi:hypothetical protein
MSLRNAIGTQRKRPNVGSKLLGKLFLDRYLLDMVDKSTSKPILDGKDIGTAPKDGTPI